VKSARPVNTADTRQRTAAKAVQWATLAGGDCQSGQSMLLTPKGNNWILAFTDHFTR